MSNPFFDHPILNSPYDYPRRHWELDEAGQPTQRTVETRRSAKFIAPIPKPKKRAGKQLRICQPAFFKTPFQNRLGQEVLSAGAKFGGDRLRRKGVAPPVREDDDGALDPSEWRSALLSSSSEKCR